MRLFLVVIVVSCCNCISVGPNCSAILNNKVSLSDYKRKKSLKCSPWFDENVSNKTISCKPGPTADSLILYELPRMQTWVVNCYCTTESNGSYAIGFCLHKCVYFGYYPLPCSVNDLEKESCPPHFNKHGYLCSECDEGYALPVYSYSMGCVRCAEYQYNWIKYLAAAYLPFTLFYIFVALFSINFTSPKLVGVVLTFQLFSNPLMNQISLNLLPNIAVRVAVTLTSILNLDFFHAYYSFCLHPEASVTAISALEFALAMYPFVLIIITYMLVKLHDHKCKVIICVATYLHKVVKFVKSDTEISLTKVFASFIYLSCCRLLLASLYFLVPMSVYTYQPGADELMVYSLEHHVMMSPNLGYLGKHHLPGFILAIFILTSFVIVPMLLLFLYPFSCFQKVLNRLGCNSLTLNTYIDVFQGCYKDGTNGMYDCRCLLGFILLLPILVYMSFMITMSVQFFSVCCILLAIYLSLHMTFRPYKNDAHNYINIGILSALFGIFLGAVAYNIIYNSLVVIYISLCIPFLYLLMLASGAVKKATYVIKRLSFFTVRLSHR